ncbi:phosphoglycerate mutase [Tumebacillus algifaecis]|uniref:Phosphoglycerate mutase n=1 Tax=Tumebacillus algifaecis TaxID=1214604 RepID=A0A223CYM5_9BACL|nr:histidine phosphatase family protein [Tumebacillus algifaecis]ASS74256.1 phosphoglycerate mutase [Tumebacillus algifaecis]
MKIGLVRHFRVKKEYPTQLVTPSEVTKWLDEYEFTDIDPAPADLGGIDWGHCYASDLPRAAQTAEIIYDGPITKLAGLREVRPNPVTTRNIKLPFMMWGLLVRVAWLLNHKSQPELRTEIEARLAGVLDHIIEQGDEDVLIVSHAACMMFMQKELRKRGFSGPKLGTPQNGKLYVFER